MQSLLDIQDETRDATEFWDHVKVDLFPDAVYVFTPKSRIMAMPRGATVVDFAYGSGIVGIAAMKAGAAHVLCADIDGFCQAALSLNQAANNVVCDFTDADLLDAPPPTADLILAGDICYEKPMTDKVMAWLKAARAQGATVLIGDPGRSYFPKTGLEKLAEYQVETTRELEDFAVKKTCVWALAD